MEWFRLREWFTSGKSQCFVLLLAGLLVSLFAGIFVTTSVFAADATWNGQSLQYQGNTYSPITNQLQIQNLGLPDDSRAYGVVDEVKSTLMVIYFAPNSDPVSVSSAEHTTYDFTPPNTYKKVSSKSITTEPAGENNSSFIGSSCGVEGIGWIVCPITSFLAKGMDWLYGTLTGFLVSRPLELTNRTSGIYLAWNIMLNISNVIFIIMLLVIIYSQVSSFGISNYGIKKMLPRLIIAAILINLSYYICAIAIDISNVTGQALQDMFIQIRNTLMTTGQETTTGEIGSWESIATFILSGGAAGAAAGVSAFSLLATTGGSAISAIYLLLPILLGVALTVIVVLLVLAARQALIVILTIISPLAFAAYLLPGTEKWFDKWKDLFLTMLIFFPAFSAVFGGSQLAGAIILQNSTTVIMVILGLAIQVVPLALAPLILKLSGGLLNRFAGVINNPSKGVLDKTKQWSQSRSKIAAANSRKKYDDYEARRNNELKNGTRRGRKWYDSINPHGAVRRAGSYADTLNRSLDDKVKNADNILNNSYQETDAYKRLDLKSRQTSDEGELISQQATNRYEELKAGHTPKDISHTTGERIMSRMTGNNTHDERMQKLSDNIQTTHDNIAVESMRKKNAERVLNKKLAESMLKNIELQEKAAGIYEFGQDSAIASATATMRSEDAKTVQESNELMKHFKLDSAKRQDLLRGIDQVVEIDGVRHTFRSNNSYTVEAALEEQMAVGTVSQVSEILSMSGSGQSLAEYRGTISAALAKSGIKGKAPFLGGKLIDDVYKGEITSKADLQQYIADWVKGGKFKPSDISIIDKEGLELLMTSIGDVGSTTRNEIGNKRLQGLRSMIEEVFDTPELKVNVADNALALFNQLLETLPKPPIEQPPSS